MNAPESDTESTGRCLRPCTHWWLAPQITKVFREIDDAGGRAKAKPLITRRGNRALTRKTNSTTTATNYVRDSEPTPHLPMNWYRSEWREGLSKVDKVYLRMAEASDLPNIVSLCINASVELLILITDW